MSIKFVHTEKNFIDSRGKIKPILDKTPYNIKSVLLIESEKGSVRGEHFHKKDNHYIYCLSGRFIYKQSKPPFKKTEKLIVKSGDLIFTKAGYWHSMEYLENSIMLALATEPRSQAKYEKDTFRDKGT